MISITIFLSYIQPAKKNFTELINSIKVGKLEPAFCTFDTIEEWKEFAPWHDDAQVEQDLVIEKMMLELFSDSFLQERIAFRGGTALHKLFLKPQAFPYTIFCFPFPLFPK